MRIKHLAAVLTMSAVLGIVGLTQRTVCADTLNNSTIEKVLTSYSEPGYKFIEKLDTGMWKVQYTRAGWRFGFEVVVVATDPDPDKSLLVVGTTVLSTEHITPEFILKLMDENSLDNNPGYYSLFYDQGIYSIQYSVKIPQSLMSEQVLLDIIGYVAGFTNSRVLALEETLQKQLIDAGVIEPSEQPAPDTDSSDVEEPVEEEVVEE